MNEFEIQVAKLLETNGWHVIRKGKGFDLLAIKGKVALMIECKDWNRDIAGKTLRKIVRRLKRAYREYKLPIPDNITVIPFL